MNHNIITLIKETATFKNIVLLGLLFLLMACFILPEATKQIKQYVGETSLIDAEFHFSSEQIYQMLEDYGEKGRDLYLVVELTADLFYSIVAVAFLSVLLFWSAIQSGNFRVRKNHLLWLLVGLLLTSILKNASIAWLLYSYPAQHHYLALIVSVLSLSKWILVMVCLTLICRNLLLCFFQKSDALPVKTVDNSRMTPF